ncbi:hypothetical protein Kpol_1002p18 [Vanderwaltozyma polyspora DSM 70294]|uniref:Uncharacterized protein n=1 Tax=Vanderwaltozyma polyspora (strain ATCC 22028 / DSM 70294 / BCRC 21397 / CBS 2163 / NBRC 10782 / NRRL Y-8283 / UCD 57-17) TaxID=436907 RepID=A7TE51_VANPO|nr:uncharacterized protein Kpol_1002p18 [Vanderwaltozyma polyspora DSM 70294]EDO19373.1 hypothetical protein Kpol_1002p18 [Vanderwaltozyma polyspora DSM 70294]
MTLYKGALDQEDQDAIVADARAGDVESLQEVFTTLIDPSLMISCRDSVSNSTALHMAAANGHLGMIQYLLEMAKNNGDEEKLKEFVNATNETGNTALHWAALNGKLDVVQLLCDEYDADPFIRNQFGHDSIYEAENNGKEEVETYFLKKYDVEPESDDEDEDETQQEGKIETIKITEGTEIESITKEAAQVLAEETEQLKIDQEKE